MHRSTFQLLRFHFSLFLLPVFLFAVSQIPSVHWIKTLYVFLILHLLVYPSSNGYNSYMDKDETPIGGLKKPLPPTKQLFYTTVVMDVVALLLSLLIQPLLSLGILFYIIASRAYSYRRIRLKKYPVGGFLTVFVFQGAVIFYLTYISCAVYVKNDFPLLPMLISSLLIGASYPLTQIYQHEADKQDGVTTLSYLLGKRGTFVFSALFFAAATTCMYVLFRNEGHIQYFYRFIYFTSPIVLFFLYWMIKVWKDEQAADFKHSLFMNILTTLCTLSFFTTLIFDIHFE